MDANTLTLIALGIILVGFVYNTFIKPFRRHVQATSGEAVIAPEAFTQATPEAPIALRTWLDYVNAQPDRVPHLAIIGPSGAGKTVLATAVLNDRPGQILVVSAKEGDAWGGLPYVGIDDDLTYATAVRTFDALYDEVKRRNLAAKQKRLTADWLTIVVDDFSTLVKECPIAADVVKLVARLGRSLRVRLVMLSDSALVKAIGLEGEGETRSNFAFIRLARGHKGAIVIDAAEAPIDTSQILRHAQRASLAPRAWCLPEPVRRGDFDDPNQFANQYGEPVRSVRSDTDAVRALSDDELIAVLVRRDVSANRICDIIGGTRSDVLARVKQLRGE